MGCVGSLGVLDENRSSSIDIRSGAIGDVNNMQTIHHSLETKASEMWKSTTDVRNIEYKTCEKEKQVSKYTISR